MTRDEEVWRQQYTEVCTVLHAVGAVSEAEDGFQWVDELKGPPGLHENYRLLRSVGYARGWMT